MTKRKSTSDKAAKPRKPAKRAAARKARKSEGRPIEGDIEDHPEGEDFDVDIEVEIDMEDAPEGDDFDVDVDIDCDDTDDDSNRRGRRRKDPFGPEGIFGAEGPFGANGPFGPNGPFGRNGVFGDNFPFGKVMKPGKGPQRAKRMRRKRMFGGDELRLVLLGLIAEEPRHGYDCIKALEEASDGSYAPSPGVVYPTLAMMVDEGVIAEQDGESARKVYEATDAGREELDERADEIDPLLDRVGRRAKRARAARSSDVMRSIGNLASVITNRAARGELNGANKDKVIDLIDEMARRIERL